MKRNQIAQPEGCVKQGGVQSLTPAQAEILTYLNNGLNVAQIAVKRSCSHQYVRKIRQQLRRLGMVAQPGYTPQPAQPKTQPEAMENNSLKRLHAQRFEFKIFHKGARFRPGVGQHLSCGTWVQCYDDKLVVYAGKDRVFSGATTEDALQASLEWWVSAFRRVEHDLDLKILKPRKAFRLVYTELADTDGRDARAVIAKEGYVRVFAQDGKLRLSFDKSKGYEREVHHAKSWHGDDSAADRHFNAILDYVDGPTLPQLARMHADLVSVVYRSLHRPDVEYTAPDWEADYFG